eukprot:2921513-Prymnesium_polylepis.1
MSKRSNTVVAHCFLLDRYFIPHELLEKILKHLLDPVEFQAELPMSFLRFVVTTKEVCYFWCPTYKSVVKPLWMTYQAELRREVDAIHRVMDQLRDEAHQLRVAGLHMGRNDQDFENAFLMIKMLIKETSSIAKLLKAPNGRWPREYVP